jgi:hypothetical protein
MRGDAYVRNRARGFVTWSHGLLTTACKGAVVSRAQCYGALGRFCKVIFAAANHPNTLQRQTMVRRVHANLVTRDFVSKTFDGAH